MGGGELPCLVLKLLDGYATLAQLVAALPSCCVLSYQLLVGDTDENSDAKLYCFPIINNQAHFGKETSLHARSTATVQPELIANHVLCVRSWTNWQLPGWLYR